MYTRKNGVFDIMADGQIRQNIREQMQRMESSIESMVLTWAKTEAEYVLEIILIGEAKDDCGYSEAGEMMNYHLRIGQINVHEFDALNRLSMAGRSLYFRLRKEFPMLQRKLSTYKYLRAKNERTVV